MNTKTMGIRDLVRESKNITDYDIIDIEDKKTKEYKGVFISHRYADDVKKMIMARRKKRLKRIMKLSGMATGLFPKEEKAIQKIKSQME